MYVYKWISVCYCFFSRFVSFCLALRFSHSVFRCVALDDNSPILFYERNKVVSMSLSSKKHSSIRQMPKSRRSAVSFFHSCLCRSSFSLISWFLLCLCLQPLSHFYRTFYSCVRVRVYAFFAISLELSLGQYYRCRWSFRYLLLIFHTVLTPHTAHCYLSVVCVYKYVHIYAWGFYVQHQALITLYAFNVLPPCCLYLSNGLKWDFLLKIWFSYKRIWMRIGRKQTCSHWCNVIGLTGRLKAYCFGFNSMYVDQWTSI